MESKPTMNRDNIIANQLTGMSLEEAIFQHGYAAGHEAGCEKAINDAAERIADKLMVIVKQRLGITDEPTRTPCTNSNGCTDWGECEKLNGCKEKEPPKQIEYMPIHPDDAQKFDCPTQFPMHLLDEGQAQRNHSQTLKRLKERGGLSVREILAIVGKKNWSYYGNLQWDEALKMLNDIITNNPH